MTARNITEMLHYIMMCVQGKAGWRSRAERGCAGYLKSTKRRHIWGCHGHAHVRAVDGLV